VNTMFMALDHHDMDPGMESALQHGNYVSYRILQGLSISQLDWAESGTNG
jgi:hypothetical protein